MFKIYDILVSIFTKKYYRKRSMYLYVGGRILIKLQVKHLSKIRRKIFVRNKVNIK